MAILFLSPKRTKYIYICSYLQAWILYCLNIDYKYIQTHTCVRGGGRNIQENRRKGEEEWREGEREGWMKGWKGGGEMGICTE